MVWARAMLAVLLGSLVTLTLSPLALDESYSWAEHTVSEAAGQSVDGAWVTRLAFVLFGLSVIWLSLAAAGLWKQPATVLHLTFGVCLGIVAAFSARPWNREAVYDRTEDLLHSVGATAMGFAFAFGVGAVWWRTRRPARSWRGALDAVAVAASVVLPLSMTAAPGLAGVFQRVMFGIAYLWYANEFLDVIASSSSTRA
jgi:hypothetical protein